jgi:anti-sigma factor RsiW
MFLHQRELVCQQAVELVTDYIEGSLSRIDRRRFEAHLSSCPHCRAYLAQMRRTIQIAGRLRSEELPSEVREELLALYRQWHGGSSLTDDYL